MAQREQDGDKVPDEGQFRRVVEDARTGGESVPELNHVPHLLLVGARAERFVVLHFHVQRPLRGRCLQRRRDLCVGCVHRHDELGVRVGGDKGQDERRHDAQRAVELGTQTEHGVTSLKRRPLQPPQSRSLPHPHPRTLCTRVKQVVVQADQKPAAHARIVSSLGPSTSNRLDEPFSRSRTATATAAAAAAALREAGEVGFCVGGVVAGGWARHHHGEFGERVELLSRGELPKDLSVLRPRLARQSRRHRRAFVTTILVTG
mmetsp:Transcript_65648/g.112863  ORF Transcript_65648/g.112863 Transcript_65648/m.112863 type:complete len:261 (+) Transcript_65648:313-1095(+)